MVGIYFDGRRIIRPQAISRIDDTGMYGRGLAGANVLAVIGEATGGEPKKVQWFTDPSYAKAILKSGNLLKAIQRAYDPSAQVNGAYMVAAIRVNPATQSELVLTDGSYNPLILIKSVDHGIWNNQLKVRIESGTSSGKKATVTFGSNYDQEDNIARQSIFLGLADPLARTGTYSVEIPVAGSSTKRLTTTVVSNFQAVFYNDDGVWSDVTTTAKELDSSYFSVALVTVDDFLYFGSDQPFGAIMFNKGAGLIQDIAAVLSGEFYNGTSWQALTGFTDGTKGVNKPFSTNGNITFTIPANWAKTTMGEAPVTPTEAYWIRLKSDTSLTAGSQGDYGWLARGITVSLSLYPTVQELIDYIDSLPHYEVGAITTKPGSEYSYHLDNASSINLMSGGNTTLSPEYTSGTTLNVISTAGFAVGDYITVARVNGSMEEARRITSIGSGTLGIDSALSTTYALGSVVREATILNSHLQALIEWFGEKTAYVTATHIDQETWQASKAYILNHAVIPTIYNGYAYVVTTAGTSGATEPVWPTTLGNTVSDGSIVWKCVSLTRGVAANIGDTYMVGGAEGTTTQSDWDECLELLQTEDVNLVTCVTPDPAVWASLSTHCSYMSTVGKRERTGFCGGFYSGDGYTNGLGKWNNSTNIAASISAMLAYAQQLNSDRMVYVGPGFTAYDENGMLTTYNGAIAAALVAGMAAGVDVAEPLTHKSVKVIGLEYNLKWSDLDRLLEGGVCPLEFDPGYGYRICQSITTWLRNDKYNRRELSVRRTADYVARQVRDRLEQDFVGTKGTLTTLISIKNATISVLTQMARADLLAGDATNPPFKNIQVRLEGDTAYVDFEASPVIPINYIPITIHLTVFATTLTA